MLTVAAASRNAVRSPIFPANSFVWITDDHLRDAFDRFASLVSASRRVSRKLVDVKCKRYGSNVPGPLEARRRLARRRFNNVSSSQHPSELGPPPHAALLFSISNGLFTEPYVPPEWKWQPPGSKQLKPRESPPLPSWFLPPKPPQSYHTPSSPSSSLADLLLRPSERISKLSVSEYQRHLLGIETLAQLQDLHEYLANATLEAAFCSSVAFDHLLVKHQRHRSLNHARGASEIVSVVDLLNFVQDGKLEHTEGANVAKLAVYMAKGNCTSLEHQMLIELIETGIKGDSLFSAQALAGLYRCVPQLLRNAPHDCVSHKLDMTKIILASFTRRVEQHAEILPPTFADLTNLNHIASALADKEGNGAATVFILERITLGLQTGNVSLLQIAKLLQEIGLSFRGVLHTNPTLRYLTDMWRMRNEACSHPSTRVRLVEPILRLVNLLPVTRSTMSFTCDLVQEHASHGKLSSDDLNLRKMRSSMGDAVRRFLFYDKLLPVASNPAGLRPLERCADSQQRSGSTDDDKIPSSLSELIDTLPSFYAEELVIHTADELVHDLSLKKREEALRTINTWLDAIFSCRNHVWAERKQWRHPVWKSVLNKLSRVVTPSEVLTMFHRTPGRDICEVLIETWIRREVEVQVSTGHDPLSPKRVDDKRPDRWFTPLAESQKDAIDELQARVVDITVNTMAYNFEYWYLQRLYKLGSGKGWAPASSAYLALLKALQVTGLPLDGSFLQLLELASKRDRPGAVEGLVHFARREFGLALTDAGRDIVEASIDKFGHTAPGRVLGIFKSNPSFCLSRNPGFLQVLISARNSHVHPRTILRLLWAWDPAATQLSRGDPGRARPNCPLSRSRVDLVHDAALAFANGSRFSTRSAWRCVLHCLRYLLYHNAPLDSRISKAFVISGILRHLRDPQGRAIPQDWLDFCVKLVDHVEGTNTADAVRDMVHKYEQSSRRCAI